MHKKTVVLTLILTTLLILVPMLATGSPTNEINGHYNVQDVTSPNFQYYIQSLQHELEPLRTAPVNQPSNTLETRRDTNADTPTTTDSMPAMLSFAQVPVSEQQRPERGINIYQIEGSDNVRFEIYMGAKPTTGYTLNVTNISKKNDVVTIHVLYKTPSPQSKVQEKMTYPSDAVEFELPPGNYEINVELMVFDTGSTQFTVE